MTNLYIESVVYETQKCGPGFGMPSLFVKFNEEQADENSLKDGKTLYQELIDCINDNKLNSIWNIALNGSQKVHIVFTSSIMAKDEHFSVFDDFYTQISAESATIQKALYQNTPQNLRPPFIIWMDNPSVFSSQKQFYEYFTCCLATIGKGKYNDLAVQEILNHTFSNIIITADNLDEYTDRVDSFLTKFKSVPSHRLRVVTSNKEVEEKCLKNQIRVEGSVLYGR